MIFKYIDYKAFILDHWLSLPKEGYGQAKRLADYLEISTVVISQTLKGERDFSAENAFRVTQFLELAPFEAQYFMKMVDYAKAGHHELKGFILNELKQMQREGKKVKAKYNKTHELSDEDKFLFYSDRFYSSVRMASSLPELNSVEDFAEYFHISVDKAEEIVEFLVRTNLCRVEEGRVVRSIQSTFLSADSPYIKNHHRNWRLYGIQKIDQLNNEEELMYTAPMSLSREAYFTIRNNLLQTIQETVKVLGPSEDEVLACLNIDFLKI